MEHKLITIRELAQKLSLSESHLLRRLSEKPQKYLIRFGIKEGSVWRFSLNKIDEAIEKGEPIIVKA